MKVSEYIVNKLIEYKVTDAFGIPGGVILKLLYAMEKSKVIMPHLMLHEQSAGFAACGYAQSSGKIGVAYATRGPGITNMITCIAEAYQESLPVLFITAHGNRIETETRFESNQELEIVNSVYNITKYAVSIDDIGNIGTEINKACYMALEGRKGPVLIDILSSLFDMDMVENEIYGLQEIGRDDDNSAHIIKEILKNVQKAKRPIILIGDGMRNLISLKEQGKLEDNLKIPIVSSRGAQDILAQSAYYYGYIGSHGTRYSNFILAKADLIIVWGNRMAFPLKSKSYEPILDQAKIIRLDIDEKEFSRNIKNTENYKINLKEIIQFIIQKNIIIQAEEEWISICREVKKELQEYDKQIPVQKLEEYLKKQVTEKIYVSDIGNNEFYVSRAYESVHPKGMLLCSKAYGTLGVAVSRSIGAYYAIHKNVVCIIGDQGFQYNAQDLYYIAKHHLPITVIVLNNRSSGMISDHEKRIFGQKLVHVDEENDYYVPNLEGIARAYGFDYTTECDKVNVNFLYEIVYSKDISLTPNLPKGNECQNMTPLIEVTKYNYINQL